MQSTCVVVADSSRARMFSLNDIHKPMEEIEHLDHARGRAHQRELGSDRPGRSFDSYGQGRHAMESSVSPARQEAIYFSREIAGYLASACDAHKFSQIALVAPPEFLGLLRKELDERVKHLVYREIDKDLTLHGEAEIRRQVAS